MEEKDINLLDFENARGLYERLKKHEEDFVFFPKHKRYHINWQRQNEFENINGSLLALCIYPEEVSVWKCYDGEEWVDVWFNLVYKQNYKEDDGFWCIQKKVEMDDGCKYDLILDYIDWDRFDFTCIDDAMRLIRYYTWESTTCFDNNVLTFKNNNKDGRKVTKDHWSQE